MDNWKRCQALIERTFGKSPDSPEELMEFIYTMADMLIESREENEKLRLNNNSQLQTESIYH